MPLPRKLLIANRGEIACRVIRTARRLGVATVAVYSDADRGAQHVLAADEALRIGEAAAARSYLDVGAILSAAVASGADAIHPGYGFLSENADFAAACANAGLCFVGPSPEAIRRMGLKSEAKRVAESAGVPTLPGYHGDEQSLEALAAAAEHVGFPLLVKAIAGGGGRGMRRVARPEELAGAIAAAQREAAAGFGDGRVLLERYLERARHIEVQVFGDRHGNLVHLFERDCSLQRRHQKVIEEAPAPGVSAALRERLGGAAVEVARAVGYVGAGTVEMLVEAREQLDQAPFFFMEMNTRLQVEHPVTELVAGLDLVEWQLRVAAGEALPLRQQELTPRGHAIEARLYAESVERSFLPSPGTLERLELPTGEVGVRVDTGFVAGDTISPDYDAMIAKVAGFGEDRAAARASLEHGLDSVLVLGVETNRDLLRATLALPSFVDGALHTRLLEESLPTLIGPPPPPGREVLALAAALIMDDWRAAPAARGGAAPGCPWQRLDGFRLVGRAATPVELTGTDGVVHTLWCEPSDNRGVRVEFEEGAVSVQLHERAGAWVRARVGGLERRWAALRQGERLLVVEGTRCQHLRFRDPERPERLAPPGEPVISAPLPGTVLALHVAQGESVAEGDAVLVLEAMKMEHTLRATIAGTVRALRAAVGERVLEGQVLVEIG